MNTEYVLPVCEAEERSILGAIIEEGRAAAFDQASQQALTSDDFFSSAHRSIYAAIMEIGEAGEGLDLISVVGKLRDHGQLSTVGGEAYVADLLRGVFYDRKSFVTIVKRIRNAANQRRLIAACQGAIAHASASGARVEESVELLTESVMPLQAGITEIQTRRIVGETDFNSWQASIGSPIKSVSLGLPCVPRLRPAELGIVGGYTGGGKTGLLLQAAADNAKDGVPTLIFSLEMTREELRDRLLAQASSVPFWKIRERSNLSDDERRRIRAAFEEISTWPLQVNDSSSLSIQRLCALARIEIRLHQIQFICVDYLQLISCNARDERERLSKVSNALRILAKTAHVPLLAASQLSRPKDGDVNKKPNRFSLKESGSIENDAHLVILTHCPTNKAGQRTFEDELIIAKQRHGPVGSEQVYFKPESLRFYSRSRYERENA